MTETKGFLGLLTPEQREAALNCDVDDGGMIVGPPAKLTWVEQQAFILPIVEGDWVATKTDGVPEIGRVKTAWIDPDGCVYMNIVLYAPSGQNIGRDSPAMGGPKTFEPAVPFDESWQRIAKPDFPLKRTDMLRPAESDPTKRIWVYTYYHDGNASLKVKAVRTVKKKQSSDRPRQRTRTIFVEKPPSNGVDIEIAAKRTAAQEMRKLAKIMREEEGPIVDRARELEAEADALVAKG